MVAGCREKSEWDIKRVCVLGKRDTRWKQSCKGSSRVRAVCG